MISLRVFVDLLEFISQNTSKIFYCAAAYCGGAKRQVNATMPNNTLRKTPGILGLAAVDSNNKRNSWNILLV